jgi:transcriptional antiterminator RfaH
MMRWHVVHTQPQAEDRALWHLRNQGFCCFAPKVIELRQHARKVRSVLAPLFPRYLFVRFDCAVARWRAINGTRGVERLLTAGPRPLPVPHGVVETLIGKCDSRGTVQFTALGVFTRGLKVRIKSGIFSGQSAEIAEILANGCDRVRVLLTLLGSQSELELPSYAIKAV